MEELRTGVYSGHILQQQAGPELICCHTCYDVTAFNGQRHYHQNAHLSLVLHGECAEKKQDSYQRSPGHLTFYHAGEPHQVLRVLSPSRHINVELAADFFTRFDVSEAQVERAVRRSPDLKFLMLRMHRELLAADADSLLAVQTLLLALLSGPAGPDSGRPAPAWVAAVDAYLRQHRHAPVSLPQLAQVAGVHPVTISRYFGRYFGCTLGDYRRKLRLEPALALIKAADTSLTDVAFACGFADQSHFIRTFKHLTGWLPMAYREL